MNDNTSSFTFTKSELTETYNQNGGLCGRADLNEIILKAFTDKQPEIASYIIYNMKSKLKKLKETDMYGRNILHYLIIFNNYKPIDILFRNIMDAPGYYKIKDLINIKDKLGNTPLHYAVMFNLNEIAEILIKNGADNKIKNNDGEYIETDKPDDIEEEPEQNPMFIPKVKIHILEVKPQTDKSDFSDILFTDINRESNLMSDNRDNNRDNVSSEELDEALNKIVSSYANPQSQTQPRSQPRQDSINLTPLRSMRTELNRDRGDNLSEVNEDEYASRIISKLTKPQVKESTENTVNSDDIRTEELAMRIIKKLKGERDESQNSTATATAKLTRIPDSPDSPDSKDDDNITPIELTMGPRVGEPPSIFMELNTEDMVNKIRQNKSQLIGGKRNKKSKGVRKLKTFSEMSYGEPINTDEDLKEANTKIAEELFDNKDKKSKKDKKDKESSEDSEKDNQLASELSEMARNIARQSSDIHERTIEKIAELLKLDLKNPEDNKKARYYKAAIWKMVKDAHPELSNYDRSVEMEKNVTKEKLKTINIEKVSKEIDKYFSEKSDSNSDSKPVKKSKPEISTSIMTETEEKPKKKALTATTKKVEKKEVEKTKKKVTKKKDEGSNQTLSISTETSSIYSESNQSSEF